MFREGLPTRHEDKKASDCDIKSYKIFFEKIRAENTHLTQGALQRLVAERLAEANRKPADEDCDRDSHESSETYSLQQRVVSKLGLLRKSHTSSFRPVQRVPSIINSAKEDKRSAYTATVLYHRKTSSGLSEDSMKSIVGICKSTDDHECPNNDFLESLKDIERSSGRKFAERMSSFSEPISAGEDNVTHCEGEEGKDDANVSELPVFQNTESSVESTSGSSLSISELNPNESGKEKKTALRPKVERELSDSILPEEIRMFLNKRESVYQHFKHDSSKKDSLPSRSVCMNSQAGHAMDFSAWASRRSSLCDDGNFEGDFKAWESKSSQLNGE